MDRESGDNGGSLPRGSARTFPGSAPAGRSGAGALWRLAGNRNLWQFARFLAVGSLNFAFYYSLFAALHFLGVAPTPAVVTATIIAVLFNFATTGRIVFGSKRAGLLPRFVSVYVVQTLLNIGSLHLLVAWGVPVLLAEALVVGVLAVLTFVALKRFVFSVA